MIRIYVEHAGQAGEITLDGGELTGTNKHLVAMLDELLEDEEMSGHYAGVDDWALWTLQSYLPTLLVIEQPAYQYPEGLTF